MFRKETWPVCIKYTWDTKRIEKGQNLTEVILSIKRRPRKGTIVINRDLFVKYICTRWQRSQKWILSLPLSSDKNYLQMCLDQCASAFSTFTLHNFKRHNDISQNLHWKFINKVLSYKHSHKRIICILIGNNSILLLRSCPVSWKVRSYSHTLHCLNANDYKTMSPAGFEHTPRQAMMGETAL